MKKNISITLVLIVMVSIAISQTPAGKMNSLIFGKTSKSHDLENLQSPEKLQTSHISDNQSFYPLELRQRLDSVYIFNNDIITGQLEIDSKDFYEYDQHGNLTQYLYMNYEPEGFYWNGMKINYTWDENHFQLSETYSHHSLYATGWKSSSKSVSTANNFGKVAEHINYMWDEFDNDWKILSKMSFEYNDSELLTDVVQTSWIENPGIWRNNFRDKNVYEGVNRIQQTRYNWNNYAGEWYPDRRYDFEYDSADNQTMFFYSFYKFSDSSWINQHVSEYFYNSANQNTLEIHSSLDTATGVWARVKVEKQFNDIGKMAQYNTFDFNAPDSSWIPDYREDYAYDLLGNLIQYVDYDWDTINNEWINGEMENVFYDNTWAFEELLLPGYFVSPEIFTHMVTSGESYSWNASGNQWEKYLDGTFYYSETNVGINEQQDPQPFTLFPNPFGDRLEVRNENGMQACSFALFDTQGRLIQSENFSGNLQLNTSELEPGMYFYTISENGNVHSGKLIKR